MDRARLVRGLARAVVVLGLGAALARASVGRTSDPDFFWHLAIAREALRTGSWLPVDTLSYSFAGAPWPYKDLAGAVTLYAGFGALGFVWIAALKALCGAAMLASMHAAPRPAERAPAITLLAGGLLLSSFWLVERPNLLSMALFSIVLALVERARREALIGPPGAFARALGAIVAVSWLWTWLHRFALFGHLLLALLALDLALTKAARRRAPVAALAFVASLGLGLLNPNGLRAYTSGFAMAAHAELRAELFEWKRPTLEEMWGAFPVALVLSVTVIAAVLARLAYARRSGAGESAVRPSHALLLAALGGLACDSFRWVPYLAIAAAFVAARLLAEHPRIRTAPAWSLAAAAVVLVAWVRDRNPGPFAVGEDPSFAPAGAVAFAEARGLRGPVANCFDFGGYLLWHMAGDVQVLVDGRTETVYPPAFVVRALRAEHDAPTFAAMRAEDGATWAFGVNFPGKPGYGFLARDPAWSLVYWSETAAVYTRRAEHADLEPLRYRYVDPVAPASSVDAVVRGAAGDPQVLAGVGGEIDRMLEASPDSPRALLCLAIFHHLQGPSHRSARDAALDRLLVAAHGDPAYERLAANIRALPPAVLAR